MRWTIEGADEKTGVDVTVSFEARNLEDAMDLARANGILPADGYPAGGSKGKPAPPLSYASPATPTAAPAAPAAPLAALPVAPALPEYRSVVTAARWVGILAAILYVLGGLCFIGAAVTAVLWMTRTRGPDGDRVLDSAAFPLELVFRGFWLIVAGAVLRLLASVALAVRDIARNSWRSR